ncbi:MAG TPA: MIP/aquaporin family protein [Cyclobacteriaceae bacterium]|nr:MIP/aquaporin family protein [Cyclobacteriaceae bacterium]
MLKWTKSENAGLLAILVGWGIPVTLAIYVVGPISGSHFNPAVTFALACVGYFPWSNVGGYVLSQVAGGIVGAVLVWLQFLPHWKRTEDASTKLAVFCTAPAIRHTFANLLSEILATAVLILALLFLGTHEFTQGLKPIVVGLIIISIGLSLGGTTGFAINPARDLGPRIAHAFLPIPGKGSSDWSYAWIPVVGPLIGGWLGVVVYQMFY